MSSFYTTFAAVAEDQYRRERATHEFRVVGGAHHHGRFAGWRERRRSSGRTAVK